jgi:hypothetical protein
VGQQPVLHDFGIAGRAKDPAQPLELVAQPADGALAVKLPVDREGRPHAARGRAHRMDRIGFLQPHPGVVGQDFADLPGQVRAYDGGRRPLPARFPTAGLLSPAFSFDSAFSFLGLSFRRRRPQCAPQLGLVR